MKRPKVVKRSNADVIAIRILDHTKLAPHIDDLLRTFLERQNQGHCFEAQQWVAARAKLKEALSREQLPDSMGFNPTEGMEISRIEWVSDTGTLALLVHNNLKGRANARKTQVHDVVVSALRSFLRSKKIRFRSKVLVKRQ